MLNMPPFGFCRRQRQSARQVFRSGRNHGFDFTHRELLESFLCQFNLQGRSALCFFFEGRNDQDALRCSGEVEDAKSAIPPLTRSSDTPAATAGIGRAPGIPSISSIWSQKSPRPRLARASFGTGGSRLALWDGK
jgi:hypothetical protein